MQDGEEKIPKKMLRVEKRERGRPSRRWMDDQSALGLRVWVVQYRSRWRYFVEKVEIRKGLQARRRSALTYRYRRINPKVYKKQLKRDKTNNNNRGSFLQIGSKERSLLPGVLNPLSTSTNLTYSSILPTLFSNMVFLLVLSFGTFVNINLFPSFSVQKRSGLESLTMKPKVQI